MSTADMSKSNAKKSESKIDCIGRQHLWDYFELHAKQRIILFRYYTTVLALFTTGTGGLFYLMIQYPHVTVLEEMTGMLLCLIFIWLSIVFQMLDKRNRQLIHNAERKLQQWECQEIDRMPVSDETEKKMEKNSSNNCNLYGIFSIEKKQKCEGESEVGHTACFKMIFISGYIVAVIVFMAFFYLAICHHFCESQGCESSVQKNTSTGSIDISVH